jgi:hypothetical protein
MTPFSALIISKELKCSAVYTLVPFTEPPDDTTAEKLTIPNLTILDIKGLLVELDQ